MHFEKTTKCGAVKSCSVFSCVLENKRKDMYNRHYECMSTVYPITHAHRRRHVHFVIMTLDEIRLRRLTNQYLLIPADKLTVVRDLCGIQSQFMGNAMHSLKIRCKDFDEETVKDGLVKNWTVRGTVHVFVEEDLPLFIHCNHGRDYRRNEWTGSTFWNQREKWALTPQRQKYLSEVILEALAKEDHTREELKQICRDHGMTPAEESNMFDAWGGGIRQLCERGFLNYVVQEKKAFCLSPEFTPIPEEEANLEIAGRYFTNFGPATIHDAMYFFHTSATQVKKWISQLPVDSFDFDGKTWFWIENGKSYDCNIPECLFLSGFDQLMLGYEKKESLFLQPENLRSIFNMAGIVMPALMLNGQIAGRWKKRDRTLSVELFRDLSPNEMTAVKAKSEELWPDIGKLDVK